MSKYAIEVSEKAFESRIVIRKGWRFPSSSQDKPVKFTLPDYSSRASCANVANCGPKDVIFQGLPGTAFQTGESIVCWEGSADPVRADPAGASMWTTRERSNLCKTVVF